MDQFRSGGFVGNDTLAFDFGSSGTLSMKGEIACLGRIVIRVEKNLVLEGEGSDPLVRTVDYAYNAWIRGRHNILRYDNLHRYEGHGDEHHKHEYDWTTGEQLVGSPSWVGVDNWPTLGQFIEEVQEWYWVHRNQLEGADEYPELGTRS